MYPKFIRIEEGAVTTKCLLLCRRKNDGVVGYYDFVSGKFIEAQ